MILAHSTFHNPITNEKTKLELRRRKDGSFGIWSHDQWLPQRQADKDEDDPTAISPAKAWQMLTRGGKGDFDHYNPDAISHCFG